MGPGLDASQDSHAKTALISAAKKLFAEKGLDGVSVREIAAEAGVNPSLVSYHFNGKENLYQYCLQQFGEGRLNAVKGILQPARSGAEFCLRIEIYIDTMFEGFLQEPDVTRMLHRECENEMSRFDETFRQTFFKIYESLFHFYREAHEAGILRSEVDPQIASGLLHGSMVHLVRMNNLIKRHIGVDLADPVYRRRLRDQMIVCSVRGLLHDQGQ